MASKSIKGITVEIDGDTKKVGDALANVTKQTGNVTAGLKQVNKLLELDPSNTVLVEQKQRLLATAIEQASEQLEILRKTSEGVTVDNAKYDEWAKKFAVLQRQITATKNDLSDFVKEQKTLEKGSDAYNALQSKIESTQEKLQSLEKQAEDTYEEMGRPVSTKQYDELQREIASTAIRLRDLEKEAEDFNKDLKKVDEKPVEDVEKAAKGAEKALDKAGKEAVDFGDILKADVIVEGIKGIVEGVGNLAEETEEYRKIMGTLEVSSEQAGYTAEETAEAYRRLYGVLGDDQSTATTVANLQALELSQEQLLSLLDGTTGAWAKYGDSIPIDGLAESVNETIRASQVTGTFADVLNWGSREGETFGVTLKENTKANEEWNKAVEAAVTAEDFFNLALQECSTEAERADLILQAMADQGLMELSDAWRQNNDDIVAANESRADFQEKTAEMAERLTPVVGAVKGGFDDMLGVVLDLTEDVDFEGFAADVTSAFDTINGAIPGVVEGIGKVVGGLWDAVKVFPENTQALEDMKNGAVVTTAEIDAIYATWGENVANIMQGAAGTYIENYQALEDLKNGVDVNMKGINIAVNSSMSTAASDVSSNMDSIADDFESCLGNSESTTSEKMSGINRETANGMKNARINIFSELGYMNREFSRTWLESEDTVKGSIENIKGFTKFEWSLPKLKMPHVTIRGNFSLNPVSTPKFSVSWYDKATRYPVLLNNATIFGAAGGKLLGGGETEQEVVAGTRVLMSMIKDAVTSANTQMRAAAAGVNVSVVIENFENYSDRDVESLADVVAERIQFQIDKESNGL